MQTVIINKAQQRAAKRFKAFSFKRKMDEGKSLLYALKAVHARKGEEKALLRMAKESQPTVQEVKKGQWVIRHPIDHDLLFNMYREAIGERPRSSKDENMVLCPNFNADDMTWSQVWTVEEIDQFCEQYVRTVVRLMRDSKDVEEIQDLAETVKSTFFAACCKICEADHEETINLLRYKLKRVGKGGIL